MQWRVILVAFILTWAAGVRAEQTQPSIDCDKETPVIMVVAGETLDRDRMMAYGKAIADSGIYGETLGYYLNQPRPVVVLEGEPSANFVTLIVRFPSQCAAEAFWFSDLYQQEIKPLRLNPSAGDYTVTLYKEADIPYYMKGRVVEPTYSRTP